MCAYLRLGAYQVFSTFSHTFLYFFHQQKKEKRTKHKDITKQNLNFALDVSVSVNTDQQSLQS